MTLNGATPRKHAEWNLLINALVEIRHNGRVIRTGVVADALHDSSALWITADGNGPRQMFEMCQGHQVWSHRGTSAGISTRGMPAPIHRGKSTG